MLVRVVIGNVEQILDLTKENAKHRVENGWAVYLSDEELDDPTLPGRIGKIPEMQPAPAPVTTVSENVTPPGYQVVQDHTMLQNAFHVFDPRGLLIRHKPWPNRRRQFARRRSTRRCHPRNGERWKLKLLSIAPPMKRLNAVKYRNSRSPTA